MNVVMLEQHYRHLQHLESAINACALSVTINTVGTVTAVNTQVVTALLQPAEALIGQPATSILPPADPRQWQRIWTSLLAGQPVQEQVCFLKPDQQPLWVEAGISPLMQEDGTMAHCILIGMDITARKLAEIKRAQNEPYYSQVLENLPLGLQQFSPDGTSLDLNTRQREIWGETHAFFTKPGYNWLEDPFYRLNGLVGMFDEVRKTGKTLKREVLLSYREKTNENITRLYPVYFEATIFPLTDPQRNMVNIFLILDDITEKKLSELSLQKSERLLDNIIENLPIGYIQFDNFGFIRRINQTQRQFFQSPHPTMMRQPFNVMNDSLATMFELDKLFLQALEENKSLRVEKRIDFSQDKRWTTVGREVYFDLTVFPVIEPVDKEMIVVALVNDITDKKMQELENRKNQEFLQQTGSIGKIGGWELDLESKQVRWTDQSYYIHDCIPGSPVDYESALSFYTPEARESLETLVHQCMSTGKPFDAQLSIISARQQLKRVRSIGQPGYIDGKLVRMYGVVQDITEQVEIKDALSRNTELMRLFFDTIDMGYAAMERNGNLNFLNRKAEKMIGHPVAIGSNIFEEFPRLSGTVFSARLRECIQQQTSQSFGIYFPVVDKWYDFLLTPMQDGGISVFMRDITDSRKLQKELRKANDQLSNLNKNLVNQNKQLEDFAHITSHNLRAPIANLKALMQMHNEAIAQHERDLYLGMVHEVIKKIDETLNDLVEVVQIRKDVNVEKEKLLFAERLQKVKDVLLVDIETSHIQITFDFDEEPMIEYPKVYLDSILQNFITNAIRYRSSERTPAVHLKTWKENDNIVLSVQDNGVGIDMERFGNKLFGFRKTFHKNKDAKGIGLFITKTQVEAMGGSIRAESHPGEGTKFIITFRSE
ncbi:signal transduction histidine kinase [Chitinophaga polysaccharea]|uniref:histidine kinase n=1 Tax=Chitinophaga polysaccharea TaxID=1293035 RepID=A0A561PTT3_9BACT|nr:PAS domain-containing protein [Chitinophaga polysaccharea]TWF41497.1 signal transduction histidine kinase [Chitinophaga polysaccharea]